MLKRFVTAGISLLTLAVGLLTIHPAVYAAGNTCTWTGATNTSWGTASNWSGCGGTIPQNGDNLVFDTTSLSTDTILTNSISSLQVGSISFTGSGSNSYTITGNDITLAGGFSDSTCSFNALSVGVTLSADQTFTATGCSPSIGLSSKSMNLGSHHLTLNGSQGIDMESPIVGDGTITISTTTQPFTFFDANSPSFSGRLNISNTRLIFNVAQPQALGTADITINDGAVLQESFNTSGSYSLSNNITLVGDGGGNNGAINLHDFTGSGTSTVTFTGVITLTGNAKIDLDNANATFFSRPVGCGYTISKSAGSSGSGGSLTGNLAGACTPAATSNYTWTKQTSAPSSDWQVIAGSSDGKYLISAAWNGHVWTSSDYGVTWMDRSGAGTNNWVGVASSSDGSRLAAGAYGGDIWISSDYGATWTDRSAAGARNWQAITESANGARLAATDYGGNIWTSSDYGVTWTDRTAAGARNWAYIAGSSDGARLVAAEQNGDVWTSSDYGATWTDRTAAGAQNWSLLASSSDGSHLAATVTDGDIWTSNDYGVTWTDRTAAGYSSWEGIAMSSDGKYLVAAEQNGDVWTSSDYGVTWVDPPGAQAWYSVFMSANGSRIAATSSPGYIWTAYDPALDIKTSASNNTSNTVLAPSTGFGAPRQSNSDIVTLAMTSTVLLLLGTSLHMLNLKKVLTH
jgi:hypothetical protein